MESARTGFIVLQACPFVVNDGLRTAPEGSGPDALRFAHSMSGRVRTVRRVGGAVAVSLTLPRASRDLPGIDHGR